MHDHGTGKHALSLRTSHNLLFVALDKELSEGNICVFIDKNVWQVLFGLLERPTM